jgi:GR25 family glycosyltransferase involved in LPS biosynthesis
MRLKLPAFAINLDKGRLPYVYKLSTDTSIPIIISKASDGSEYWDSDIKMRHPWGNERLTPGMMGCTKSHMNLLDNENRQGVYIFEDDTELVMSMEHVERFIDEVLKTQGDSWDIILLGANEYVNSKPITHEINRVYRFWGTHAMIINYNAYDFIKKTFYDALDEGVFLPADWMYNEAIRQYKLRVFAPSSPKLFFRQLPGLVSAITGKIRD